MSREYKFRFNDIIPDQVDTPKTQPTTLNSYRHQQSNDAGWIGQPTPPLQSSTGHSHNPNSNIEWIGNHQIIHLGGSRDRRHKQSANNQNGSPSSTSKDTILQKQQAVSSWQPLAQTSIGVLNGKVMKQDNNETCRAQSSKAPNKTILQQKLLSKMVKNVQRVVSASQRPSFSLIKQYSSNQNRMLKLFMNHCATIIQKNVRRWLQQKYYRHFKAAIHRMKQLINAVSEGWRTRRILKLRSVQKTIEEIKKKQQEGKLKDMRILKRDLAKQLNKLNKKGSRWIEEWKEQRQLQKAKNHKFRFLQQSATGIKNTDIQAKRMSPTKPVFETKISLREEAPLPTHKSSNKCPTVNIDEVPIKANPTNSYQFDFSDSNQQSVVSIPVASKSQPKKQPPKKKVIKLASNETKTEAPSVVIKSPPPEIKSEPQSFYLPSRTAIQGDMDPLDVTEKQLIESHAIVQQKPLPTFDIQLPNITQVSSKEPEVDGEDQRKRLMKKRMKYDPRKAIEEEKRKKAMEPQVKAPSEPKSHSREKSVEQPRGQQTKSFSKGPKQNLRNKSPTLHNQPGPLNQTNKSKQLSATLKRLPRLETQTTQQPITRIQNVRSPTANIRQRHIPLSELQTTYNSSYISKKHEIVRQTQQMDRKMKRMNYPICTIRQFSSIFKKFDLACFTMTERRLEMQWLTMLNL